MSPDGEIKFRLVPGIRRTSGRAIGFLEGRAELTASAAADSLKGKRRYFLLGSMQRWVDGLNGPPSRFHGFPNDRDYKMCFVFKVRENGSGHRFYGYLYHPMSMSPRFQVCVLCIHARKNEHETDRAELKRVKVWFESAEVRQAVSRVFSDDSANDQEEKRVPKWKM